MSEINQIGQYFTKNVDSSLQDTLQKGLLLQKFSRELREFLRPPLGQHVHFANIRDNMAIITVDDAT